jgi:hypothetical protein
LILNSNKDNNIMANPTTAEEWQQVVAQYKEQNAELAKTDVELSAEAQSLFKQRAQLTNEINALKFNRPPFNTNITENEYKLKLTALEQQQRQVIIQRENVLNEKAQIAKQISENNAAIAKANTSAGTAEQGPANAETITPPASPAPGDGAIVPPPPPLIQTSSTPQPVTSAENPSTVETAAVTTPQITTTNTVITNFDTEGIDLGDQIPTPQPIIVEGDYGDTIVVTPPIIQPKPKSTIESFDDYGNPLILQTPEEIARQKAVDEYRNEFQGVDEAIAKQKQVAIDSYANEFTGVDEAIAAQNTPLPTGSSKGLQGDRTNSQAQSTAQNQANFALKQDWRVRLSLAPNSSYLYNAANVQGILQPLIDTNGVVFPYTPSIQIQYNAHYDNYDLTHSNYKIYQYKNSSIDTIQISCDFTAQDTAEANYLLAVIHFFRSVTKMFYGKDSIPKIGTPPPLCFLSGLGSFQFDNHPLVITNFSYNLPTDVDYIRASASATTEAGVNKSPAQIPNHTNSISNDRLNSSPSPIATGGVTPSPNFGQQTLIQSPSASSRTPTYVPTKMNISISANPIVTRNDISNRFSVRDYATGKLLQGSKNSTVGIW